MEKNQTQNISRKKNGIRLFWSEKKNLQNTCKYIQKKKKNRKTAIGFGCDGRENSARVRRTPSGAVVRMTTGGRSRPIAELPPLNSGARVVRTRGAIPVRPRERYRGCGRVRHSVPGHEGDTTLRVRPVPATRWNDGGERIPSCREPEWRVLRRRREEPVGVSGPTPMVGRRRPLPSVGHTSIPDPRPRATTPFVPATLFSFCPFVPCTHTHHPSFFFLVYTGSKGCKDIYIYLLRFVGRATDSSRPTHADYATTGSPFSRLSKILLLYHQRHLRGL